MSTTRRRFFPMEKRARRPLASLCFAIIDRLRCPEFPSFLPDNRLSTREPPMTTPGRTSPSSRYARRCRCEDVAGAPSLEPQARELLQRFAVSPAPALNTLTVADARRAYREGRLALAPPPLAIEETRDFFFPGTAG